LAAEFDDNKFQLIGYNTSVLGRDRQTDLQTGRFVNCTAKCKMTKTFSEEIH